MSLARLVAAGRAPRLGAGPARRPHVRGRNRPPAGPSENTTAGAGRLVPTADSGRRRRPGRPSNNAETNSLGSNSSRSSEPSPTPMSLIGNPSSFRIARTMPPLAVPSSLVSTTPVTPTASVNCLACRSPFWPVVASSTRRPRSADLVAVRLRGAPSAAHPSGSPSCAAARPCPPRRGRPAVPLRAGRRRR